MMALSKTPRPIPPYFDSMCVLTSPSSQAFLIISTWGYQNRNKIIDCSSSLFPTFWIFSCNVVLSGHRNDFVSCELPRKLLNGLLLFAQRKAHANHCRSRWWKETDSSRSQVSKLAGEVRHYNATKWKETTGKKKVQSVFLVPHKTGGVFQLHGHEFELKIFTWVRMWVSNNDFQCSCIAKMANLQNRLNPGYEHLSSRHLQRLQYVKKSTLCTWYMVHLVSCLLATTATINYIYSKVMGGRLREYAKDLSGGHRNQHETRSERRRREWDCL